MRILAILGKIYLILLIIFWVYVWIAHSIPMIPARGIWGVLDLAGSWTATFGTILFIFNKEVLPRKFWKIFTIVFIIFDLALALFIGPMVDHRPLEITKLYVFPFVILPFYITLILYSFRKKTVKK